MSKKRIATVWLDGCSGCHMSFLDMDERLLTVAGLADLVYSPLVDAKIFPEDVDVTLVEGAVSSEDDLHKIKLVRARTKTLVSLGDCAVTANVPGMRNPFGSESGLRPGVSRECYVRSWDSESGRAQALLPNSRPMHEFVNVDVFVPGCPPSADTIYYVVSELAGRPPARRERKNQIWIVNSCELLSHELREISVRLEIED
jgi:NAD-reducing hydrogenase small subunit